ncbi:hypothetical protein PPL_08650 [Heterostelium album PN500]|uniref:Uncharacterized protein n=1 Tax=Heterostelium pallidum (strain ATCC 26659 / Pp 5 / PN500) TaxID=670386 RepID=D3BJC5_HETP5|nr:hypothetical protein PPL_08650 [Heterostelium album PN500]EFA78005.1 hypothetical protein PPL_08650 [Heterostelium album PN500]|eukprot:XP_020430133.1 hypothetical protein PPL_08650 [Heterostelium album PN500]
MNTSESNTIECCNYEDDNELVKFFKDKTISLLPYCLFCNKKMEALNETNHLIRCCKLYHQMLSELNIQNLVLVQELQKKDEKIAHLLQLLESKGVVLPTSNHNSIYDSKPAPITLIPTTTTTTTTSNSKSKPKSDINKEEMDSYARKKQLDGDAQQRLKCYLSAPIRDVTNGNIVRAPFNCLQDYLKNKREYWKSWCEANKISSSDITNVDQESDIDQDTCMPQEPPAKRGRPSKKIVDNDVNNTPKKKKKTKVLKILSDYCVGYFEDLSIDSDYLENESVIMQHNRENTRVHLVVDGSEQNIQTPKDKKQRFNLFSGSDCLFNYSISLICIPPLSK